jgi:hypothetical protein
MKDPREELQEYLASNKVPDLIEVQSLECTS